MAEIALSSVQVVVQDLAEYFSERTAAANPKVSGHAAARPYPMRCRLRVTATTIGVKKYESV